MKLICVLIITFTTFLSFSQNYSRVQIFIGNSDVESLLSLGVNLDHAQAKGSHSIIAELNKRDITKLENSGFSFHVLIEDLESFYADQLDRANYRNGAHPCDNGSGNNFSPITPENFSLGSMGGYLTYNEFLQHLDSMAVKFPNLITSKAPISNYTTHEGRPIYHCVISDNPGVNEGEEQVLYTSIHHAREPASLSQNIFYMWYLLENYDTNPEIQYLIDHNELHFVPMINPDGYVYNETTNPNGGGMWRKNRRPNGGSSFGVDLNRNYSYQWGVSGTSTNPNDDTYCGPTPFSEPETQAIKWLCENNNFKFAFNTHTNGDLLLFPFGYSNNDFAPDHDYFFEVSSHMVKHNHYANQKSSDLYPAAGDSDDWMYDGDLNAKPKIYAFTPEIGPDAYGFWPNSSEIDEICKDNVFQNMRLAHLPHIYGEINDLEENVWSETSDYINFRLKRYGLTDGDFTISITPISGFNTIGSPKTISGMQLLDEVEDSISYDLQNLIAGDEIIYILNIDNGTITLGDTIRKTFGNPPSVFIDPANDLLNWTSTTWDNTSEDSYSPSTSITDSPNSNYGNLTTNEIRSNFSIDLTNATQAYVSFWAKWNIEADYDFVQFEVSNDNGFTWIPMCGNYTNPGTNNQVLDEPLYDGVQNDWVQEQITLQDFLGESVLFRFSLQSDLFVNGDGFYFDDFNVQVDQLANLDKHSFNSFSIYPNPSRDKIFIQHDFEENLIYNIIALDGSILKSHNSNHSETVKIDISSLSSGMYILNIIDNNGRLVGTNKIMKH